MAQYVTLDSYSFGGINGLLTPSPGGTSASANFYTGGMYGDGASTSNVYAPPSVYNPPAVMNMQNPNPPSGEYGSMYQEGTRDSRVGDLEFIPSPNKEAFSESISQSGDKKVHIIILFIIVAIFWIGMNYWSEAFDSYISRYIGNEKDRRITSVCIVAVLLTGVFFLATYLANISSVKIFG